MTTSGKILVVDDNEPGRYVKTRILRQAGWDVSETAHGAEALRRVTGDAIDLVVLDIRLPDIDGMEVCREIKAGHPDIFVLQTSATFTQSFDRVRSLDSGADAYLIEPMEPQELLATVRSLFRIQRVESALRDSETRLQLAQEAAGLAALDWNLVTNEIVWSPNFAEVFHLAPEEAARVKSFADVLNRVHPEDRPAVEAKYAELRQQGGSFEHDFRVVSSGGRVRWIASRGTFIKGPSGSPDRLLCLNADATKRKESELSNAQLASVVASSADAIVSFDIEGRILTWNDAAARLFGYDAAEAVGRTPEFAVPAERTPERAQIMQRLHAGEIIEYYTVRERKDGRRIDVWIRGAPMRAADGKLIGASLIVRDTTAQTQREEHVRYLMRELTHRSKNLLAVIQAMARQSLAHHASPEEFVARFSERLSGLAGSHDLLSSDDFEGASLTQLIRSQLSHYEELLGKRIGLEGTDVFLRPEAAQNIGIALHELSTNAAKYGALSAASGSVDIAWSVMDDPDKGPRFRMTWQERGGAPVEPPRRKGFGHVVMDRITGQALGGISRAEFAPDGVTWTLDVPAASVIRTREDEARFPL